MSEGQTDREKLEMSEAEAAKLEARSLVEMASNDYRLNYKKIIETADEEIQRRLDAGQSLDGLAEENLSKTSALQNELKATIKKIIEDAQERISEAKYKGLADIYLKEITDEAINKMLKGEK